MTLGKSLYFCVLFLPFACLFYLDYDELFRAATVSYDVFFTVLSTRGPISVGVPGPTVTHTVIKTDILSLTLKSNNTFKSPDYVFRKQFAVIAKQKAKQMKQYDILTEQN